MRRRIHRTDNTQAQIVSGLRAVGFHVELIGRPADLAIRREGWLPGTYLMLDAKTKRKPRKDQEAQTAYFAEHGIQIAVTVLEAVEIAWRAHAAMNYVGIPR